MFIFLKKCPICGREVDVRGGEEEWKPTYYDPDSGGEPYYIHCDCGLEFRIGYCEYNEFQDAWNNRAGIINDIEECKLVSKYMNDNETEDYIEGYKTGYNKAIDNVTNKML